MADATPEVKEESVENILKSIKSIISGKPGDVQETKPAAAPEEQQQASAPVEDELVLTEKVSDEKPEQPLAPSAPVENNNAPVSPLDLPPEGEETIEPAAPAPAASGNDVLSNIDRALSGEEPIHAPVAEVSPPQPAIIKNEPVVEKRVEEKPISLQKETLIENTTARTSHDALKNLMDAIPKPKIDSMNLRGGSTLEDLVVEALRPMMSEWLNKNLPVIVQQIVEKEIKKIVPKE